MRDEEGGALSGSQHHYRLSDSSASHRGATSSQQTLTPCLGE